METDKKSWHLETTEKVEEAANNGDARAQTVLGYRYHFGIEGLSEDHFEAVGWYRKAAEKGFAVAQACLAGMYYDVCGITKGSARTEQLMLAWRAEAKRWRDKSTANSSVYTPTLPYNFFCMGENKFAHLQML